MWATQMSQWEENKIKIPLDLKHTEALNRQLNKDMSVPNSYVKNDQYL